MSQIDKKDVIAAIAKTDQGAADAASKVYGEYNQYWDKLKASNGEAAKKLAQSVEYAKRIAKGSSLNAQELSAMTEGFKLAEEEKAKGFVTAPPPPPPAAGGVGGQGQTPPGSQPITNLPPTPGQPGVHGGVQAPQAAQPIISDINKELDTLKANLKVVQDRRTTRENNPFWQKAESVVNKTIDAEMTKLQSLNPASPTYAADLADQTKRIKGLIEVTTSLDKSKMGSLQLSNAEEVTAYSRFYKTIEMMSKVESGQIRLLKLEQDKIATLENWDLVLDKKSYDAQAATSVSEKKAIDAETNADIAQQTAGYKRSEAILSARNKTNRAYYTGNNDARRENISNLQYYGNYSNTGDRMALQSLQNAQRIGSQFIPNLPPVLSSERNNLGVQLFHGLAQAAVRQQQFNYGRAMIQQENRRIFQSAPPPVVPDIVATKTNNQQQQDPGDDDLD